MSNHDPHQAVLLHEAVELLAVQPDCWYVDGTFGRGGHTAAILAQGGRVIALDYDEQAIQAGAERFKSEVTAGQLILVRENFAGFATVWPKLPPKAKKISGALFDFGTSIEQLRYDQRGLSFLNPELPLDMRLDSRLGVTAADLLMVLDERQLANLFFEAGGEMRAKAIARAIAQQRKRGKVFQTTGDLIELIQKISPHRQGHLHPATKVFQALRIAVNDELSNIADGLPIIFTMLEPGSRLVTISFHEGEDRIVKRLFKELETAGEGILITKKPITPGEIEIKNNSRSRSAKLRALEKQHAATS